MKKMIALLLVAVMSLSLVACGGKDVEASADAEQQKTLAHHCSKRKKKLKLPLIIGMNISKSDLILDK